MSNAPVYEIDPVIFRADPYPDLARMRAIGPFVLVPQLGATLIVRREEVFRLEKRIDVFSSHQPGGLMSVLMGENMMRKDGAAHMAERRAIFPSVSPRTVRDVWRAAFEQAADAILDQLAPKGRADLVSDYAMPLSAEALKAMTGLTNMHFAEMDRVSQGMIDGIANYGGDPQVEAHCHDCTASIDRHIDERLPVLAEAPDTSLISVQLRAGLSDAQMRANVKLAISGGQNEPRDAIAGAAWALLTHPDARAAVMQGRASWMQVFEEYARWISPIGMSPRRIAAPHQEAGVTFNPEDRAFLMFGSANRDERVWRVPERFDIFRDVGPSVAFGAGPHFCAGAWASRSLIAEVALPRLFTRLPGLRLDGDAPFEGWAFRGPLSVPVAWD
ncbi:MAG: cytochrome P450 [Pararhodobacter sp.]|nr:cytochrome P450 [Pararhodobacter sp.]